MAQKRITDLPDAGALNGSELVEVAQLGATTYTAVTLSAQASDNSFNDSAAQFIAEGFAVGNRVKVSGFTGNVANNILVGTITALTAAKMTIGGTDGDVIVDDAAGESVTITKWESKRTSLAAGSAPTESLIIAIGDETTDITAGAAKVTFRMPYAFTLTGVRASLTTASSSGNPAVDINEGGVSILSTKITIDATEKTSTTAATPPVISDSALADDAEITIDIDTAGTGAKGLKVYLIGHPGRFGAGGPASGYAKWSSNFSSPSVTLSGSDLVAAHGGTNNVRRIISTLDAKGSGQWYAEVTVGIQSGSDFGVAVGNFRMPLNGDYLGRDANSIMYVLDGRALYANVNHGGSPGAYVSGDVIGIAVDASTKTIRFRRNGGGWSSSYVMGTNGAWMIAVQMYKNGDTATVNFGATAWHTAPPSGYVGWTERGALPSARYWRHHVVLTDGNNQASIAETELRPTVGGSDATGSGTPSSLSAFSSPTYDADKAVDNNFGTIAHSANNQGAGWWWQYDFGAAQAVQQISLTMRNDILHYSSEYHWAYSDDGTIFYPTLAIVGHVGTIGQTVEHALN